MIQKRVPAASIRSHAPPTSVVIWSKPPRVGAAALRYSPRSLRVAWWPGAPSIPTSTCGAAACQAFNSTGVTAPHCPAPVAVREGWLISSTGSGASLRMWSSASSICCWLSRLPCSSSLRL